MKEFVEQLALKYPQWTFVENGVTSNMANNTYEVHAFKVMDKREVLGTLSKDWANNGNRYCFDNHRISSMRERGNGMKTIHMNKAIKHVNKLFGKKNVHEKLNEAKQLLGGALGGVINHKEWQLRTTWNALAQSTQAFIVSHYQEFADSVVDKNLIKPVEQLPTHLEEHIATQYMKEVWEKNNAYVVFIEGINYSVQKGEDPIEVKESDELPDFMRRAIGLLKLVENNQVVNGVGLRVNESTFLVLP
jgi:methyl coenzyme M reductase alpha subunit